ncbi:OmpA family protein [Flexithrix dorotheae]|uniref:OmpA family protein n=1 Tax=Flexithrix dorotheae TaxID=70993 RepID=UPI000367926C|nr:OmpA family protein [Flexithrix dorotheae]
MGTLIKIAFSTIFSFFFIAFVSFQINVYGQTKPTKEKHKKTNLKRLLADAEEFCRVEEYNHAIPILLEYDSLEPKDLKCNYLLGISLYELGRKEAALEKLKFVWAKSEKEYETLPSDKFYFYYARCFQLSHQFDSAIHFFELHRQFYEKRYEASYRKDSDYFINQCEIGKQYVEEKTNIETFNLGPEINTEYPELAPVISADENTIIFTSRRPDSKGGEIDPFDQKPYEDIYMSVRNGEGVWMAPVNMTSINTEDHDASISLSPEGDKLFIYRNGGNMFGDTSGDIYMSKKENDEWMVPEKMQEGVNSREMETHTSINAEGNVMFLSSNRETETSMGGKDIYIVRRLPDNSWAKPENLGPVINTPFDEDSPFVSPDGNTLYFSSEGHNSMGGFDIFYTEFDKASNTWSAPVNMGYPVNTADDDIFMVWSPDRTRGYFSSGKEGGYGDHDIYVVMVPEKEYKLIALKGRVYDDDTNESLKAAIEVYDNEKQELIKTVESNGENGKYTLYLDPEKNYGIRVLREGYLFKSINIHVPDQFEYLEVKKNFNLKPIDDTQIEKLNNIFIVGDAEIDIKSGVELQAVKDLIERNPGYFIEIAVHSDNSGDTVLSLVKSQAQAEAIIAELKSYGTPDEKLLGKGYGLGGKFPLASNNTFLGRKKNNRIEYIVRKDVPKPKQFNYQIIYDEFLTKTEEKPCSDYNVGELVKLANKIVYSSLSPNLNDEADEAIAEIVRLMDNCPNLKLEIGGHTDNKGSEEFKQKLSEKMARKVAQKIVFEGIERNKLAIKGYGDTQPAKGEKSKNSRVEFKVEENHYQKSMDKDGNPIPQVGDLIGKSIYFPVNAHNLKDTDLNHIDKLVSVLKKYPKMKIEVAGHSDDSGSKDYNIKLSDNRARTIAQWLYKKQISPERISIKAYGSSKPVSENTSLKGRSLNRRCEFIVTEME